MSEEFKDLKPEVITVSAEEFEELMRAIENPAQPNERLKALMRRKPVWDDAAAALSDKEPTAAPASPRKDHG